MGTGCNDVSEAVSASAKNCSHFALVPHRNFAFQRGIEQVPDFVVKHSLLFVVSLFVFLNNGCSFYLTPQFLMLAFLLERWVGETQSAIFIEFGGVGGGAEGFTFLNGCGQ